MLEISKQWAEGGAGAMCECTVCNSWGGAKPVKTNWRQKSVQIFRTASPNNVFYFAFLTMKSPWYRTFQPRLQDDYGNPTLSGEQPQISAWKLTSTDQDKNPVFTTNSWGHKQDIFHPLPSLFVMLHKCTALQRIISKDIDPVTM